MYLIKTKIEEHYKSAGGDFAVIEMFPDDKVVLTIRNHDCQPYFQKEYKNRKGARIALGKFGKWEYVITVDTIKKNAKCDRDTVKG